MDEHNIGPSNYEGVVAQPNRNWGTQIYLNQPPIGLGSFKSEMVSGVAYDQEGITLRYKPLLRNVYRTDTSLHKPSFQAQFGTDTVPSTMEDASYTSKSSEIPMSQGYNRSTKASHDHRHLRAPKGKVVKLFHKELTPSDVGKLNRLVIPKKHAVKHLPKIPGVENKNTMNGNNTVEELELLFFDRTMTTWKLRYCYWKSSRSFVFTTGWNRFAKGKGLRAKDKVIFSTYERDGLKLLIIDVDYCNEGTKEVKVVGDCIRRGKELEMKMDEDEDEDVDEREATKTNELESVGIQEKGIKLFGFQIQI